MEIYEINKISLSCLDYKIYIQNNGCDGWALDNHSKQFFLQSYKNINLFFYLIRTAFFTFFVLVYIKYIVIESR